jgi:catechol 2,3-dioxygenase-like lactoylglutathione lyase family enzyme
MDVGAHCTVVGHLDPDASIRFYLDGLGLELLDDVGIGEMRWLTFATGVPGYTLLLEPGTPDPSVVVTVQVEDVVDCFDGLVALGAEPILEPVLQRTGVVECQFLDPAGAIVRLVASLSFD